MDSTCFCSVIHPGNIEYFSDFLESLKAQTDKNFTLLLFNDNVVNLDLYLNEYHLPYKIIAAKGSIAEIRYQMLQHLLKSDYKFTIFGDTDDFFPNNRVAVNKLLLQNYDVVVNDVWLVSAKGEVVAKAYWENRQVLKQPITFNSIKDYNFIGLGNTAIRTEILYTMPGFEAALKVVDWFLFSTLLYKNNLKVIFTSETYIFYRQHQENLIGRKKITLQKLKNICITKSEHYTMLAKEIPEMQEMALRYGNFIKVNDFDDMSMLDKCITKIPNPFWWEEFIV